MSTCQTTAAAAAFAGCTNARARAGSKHNRRHWPGPAVRVTSPLEHCNMSCDITLSRPHSFGTRQCAMWCAPHRRSPSALVCCWPALPCGVGLRACCICRPRTASDNRANLHNGRVDGTRLKTRAPKPSQRCWSVPLQMKGIWMFPWLCMVAARHEEVTARTCGCPLPTAHSGPFVLPMVTTMHMHMFAPCPHTGHEHCPHRP